MDFLSIQVWKTSLISSDVFVYIPSVCFCSRTKKKPPAQTNANKRKRNKKKCTDTQEITHKTKLNDEKKNEEMVQFRFRAKIIFRYSLASVRHAQCQSRMRYKINLNFESSKCVSSHRKSITIHSNWSDVLYLVHSAHPAHTHPLGPVVEGTGPVKRTRAHTTASIGRHPFKCQDILFSLFYAHNLWSVNHRHAAGVTGLCVCVWAHLMAVEIFNVTLKLFSRNIN